MELVKNWKNTTLYEVQVERDWVEILVGKGSQGIYGNNNLHNL